MTFPNKWFLPYLRTHRYTVPQPRPYLCWAWKQLSNSPVSIARTTFCLKDSLYWIVFFLMPAFDLQVSTYSRTGPQRLELDV